MRDKVRRKFACVKIIKIKNIPKKEREATKIEVELLKRLNHPNIVRYVDSFLSRNNESLCIAMEYCDGGDLASQIKAARRKLFSEDKILHWFVQIALGVHYMHTKNVLHRDLKTQNIFLLGNGRLVLGDLGISKVLEGTMDFAQTCIGTPYYMSPEIFKNKPYSYKSDVWALGCVLYEMTTLNHAFDANSLNGLAQKIIKGRYPAIHHKYSRYLRELIGHMLLPEPKQRPDLDQILRKPFIRKHILNFFQNIASRPSQSIGEGTMIVRAAAGGMAGSFANDANMLSFKEQLDSLGMTSAISELLGGGNRYEKVEPSVLEDPVKAKRIAKEQSNALKREQVMTSLCATIQMFESALKFRITEKWLNLLLKSSGRSVKNVLAIATSLLRPLFDVAKKRGSLLVTTGIMMVLTSLPPFASQPSDEAAVMTPTLVHSFNKKRLRGSVKQERTKRLSDGGMKLNWLSRDEMPRSAESESKSENELVSARTCLLEKKESKRKLKRKRLLAGKRKDNESGADNWPRSTS